MTPRRPNTFDAARTDAWIIACEAACVGSEPDPALVAAAVRWLLWVRALPETPERSGSCACGMWPVAEYGPRCPSCP